MLDLTPERGSSSWHEREKEASSSGGESFWVEAKNSDERRADFDKIFTIAEFA